jgi:hypothetical protein
VIAASFDARDKNLDRIQLWEWEPKQVLFLLISKFEGIEPVKFSGWISSPSFPKLNNTISD